MLDTYHMLLGTNKKKFVLLACIAAVLALGYFLSLVFSGTLILRQYFSFGPLRIHYYGFTMAGAVLAGYLLARKRAAQYKIDLKITDDLIFWLVIGGFVGARLYHVLSSVGYYTGHPIDIFRVWNGGLSIYGAVIGGVITLAVEKKIFNFQSFNGLRTGFSIFNLLDWLAPSVILGQIIGRFGNLFNYEAFGYPTSLPWKMFVPPSFRPETLNSFAFYHPLFLYEVLGNLLILLFLLKRSRQGKPGMLFFFYLLLYNILRFFLEFLRTDSTFIGAFRLNVVSSFCLAAVSIVALLFINRKTDRLSPHAKTP